MIFALSIAPPLANPQFYPNLAVVVLNFGMHYGSHQAYEVDVGEALQQLSDFAAQPGRVAIYRESSVQHFPIASGSM